MAFSICLVLFDLVLCLVIISKNIYRWKQIIICHYLWNYKFYIELKFDTNIDIISFGYFSTNLSLPATFVGLMSQSISFFFLFVLSSSYLLLSETIFAHEPLMNVNMFMCNPSSTYRQKNSNCPLVIKDKHGSNLTFHFSFIDVQTTLPHFY